MILSCKHLLVKNILIFFLLLQSCYCHYKATNPIGQVDIGQFRYNVSLNGIPKDYNLHLFWNVSADGKELIAALALTTSNLSLGQSWAAIAFGGIGMIHSQFIVCHNNQNSKNEVVIHEHESVDIYITPPTKTENLVIKPLLSFGNTSMQVCLFSRPLNPNDSEHLVIDANVSTKIMYAYSPTSDINYMGKSFSYHGTDKRGALSINFANGLVGSAKLPSFLAKQIHGFGMMFIWLFVIPGIIFYARFYRQKQGWIVIKSSLAVLSTVMVVSFSIVVITMGQGALDSAHSYIGLVVLSLNGIQVLLGTITLLGFSNESLLKFQGQMALMHRINGYLLFLLAVVNIGLGINILYPWSDPRTIVPWVVYIVSVCIWLFVFGGAQIWRIIYNSTVSLPKTRKETALKATEDKSKTQEELEVFTWKTLDEAIRNDGRMLVVGNGKYVYDISKWIHSHPGGQIILHNVNGTDITNDYFNEAGYDADEITKNIDTVPPKKTHAKVEGMSTADVINLKTQTDVLADTSSAQIAIASVNAKFTTDDWSCIQRSRRTHVHSRVAVQKLAELVVGRMVDDGEAEKIGKKSIDTLSEVSCLAFDQHEYRRYALTGFENLSSPSSARPSFKLRFCILYPYDRRRGQPLHFLPGQCIELQLRLGNGKLISRYYTPIRGDMDCLEIIARMNPGGEMTPFLFRCQKGERQFKIRGPFGAPLLSLPTQIGVPPADIPETIYFFAGGSGITPFLQIVQQTLLSTKFPLQVAREFTPTMTDELEIKPGQFVTTLHHFYDGWASGHNLSTNIIGSFPLGLVFPLLPIRLVLINLSDLDPAIVGYDIVQGAELAYPTLLQYHQFTSKTLTKQAVSQILDFTPGKSKKVYICGPNAMNSVVSDMMNEFGPDWFSSTKILSPHSYN